MAVWEGMGEQRKNVRSWDQGQSRVLSRALRNKVAKMKNEWLLDSVKETPPRVAQSLLTWDLKSLISKTILISHPVLGRRVVNTREEGHACVYHPMAPSAQGADPLAWKGLGLMETCSLASWPREYPSVHLPASGSSPSGCSGPFSTGTACTQVLWVGFPFP